MSTPIPRTPATSPVPPTEQPACVHILENNTGYRVFRNTLNPNVPCERCAKKVKESTSFLPPLGAAKK